MELIPLASPHMRSYKLDILSMFHSHNLASSIHLHLKRFLPSSKYWLNSSRCSWCLQITLWINDKICWKIDEWNRCSTFLYLMWANGAKLKRIFDIKKSYKGQILLRISVVWDFCQLHYYQLGCFSLIFYWFK